MLRKRKTNAWSQEIRGISGESLALNVRLRNLAVCFFGFGGHWKSPKFGGNGREGVKARWLRVLNKDIVAYTQQKV